MAKAMVYSKYGRPSEVLRLHQHPLPPLTPTTLHLRFLAVPINPADVNQVEGAYPLKPPFTNDLGTSEPVAVGGNEGVAEVIAVGEEIKDVKVGDWVIMANAGFGTWRTHAAATAQQVQVLPNKGDLSLIQAATLAVNPCTAYRMIKDFVDLQPGDFLIQNGANSGVGQAVIELSKAWGVNTINVVRNRPDLDSLKAHLTSLGATHVITEEELSSREIRGKIKEWTGGKPILLGLNCVGGKNATDMARILGDNAHHVTYGAMSKQPLTLPASLLIFKNIKFHGFWMTRWVDVNSKETRAEMLGDLIGLIQQGKLGEVKSDQIKWGSGSVEEEGKLFAKLVEEGITGFGGGKRVIMME